MAFEWMSLEANLSYPLQHSDLFFESITQVHFYAFGVVMALDTGPELDGGTKIAGQSQCCIRTDAGTSKADFIYAHGRNADILGQSVLADAHWL